MAVCRCTCRDMGMYSCVYVQDAQTSVCRCVYGYGRTDDCIDKHLCSVYWCIQMCLYRCVQHCVEV